MEHLDSKTIKQTLDRKIEAFLEIHSKHRSRSKMVSTFRQLSGIRANHKAVRPEVCSILGPTLLRTVDLASVALDFSTNKQTLSVRNCHDPTSIKEISLYPQVYSTMKREKEASLQAI